MPKNWLPVKPIDVNVTTDSAFSPHGSDGQAKAASSKF